MLWAEGIEPKLTREEVAIAATVSAVREEDDDGKVLMRMKDQIK